MIAVGPNQINSATDNWTTMQLGQIDVHIRLPNFSWSPSSSCSVCSNKSTGYCPLWPSCSSRQSSCSANREFKNIYVQIKPEFLGDWGCEILSPEELADSWLGSTIRGDSDILRIRVRSDNGEVVWAEYQSLEDLIASNPNIRPNVNLGFLCSLFDQLLSHPSGSFLLTQNDAEVADSFEVYIAATVDDASELSGNNVLDLHAVHQRFCDSTSSLIQMINHESWATNDIRHPWCTVANLKLDLNIPAGLEPADSFDETRRRGFRLPGLPPNRFPTKTAHLKHPTESTKRASVDSLKTSPKQPSKRPKRNSKSGISKRH